MMNDYEKNITDNIYKILRNKIIGKVTVYVNDDTLYMIAQNGDFKYVMKEDGFADKVYHGLNSTYEAYVFCKNYSEFINNKFFK